MGACECVEMKHSGEGATAAFSAQNAFGKPTLLPGKPLTLPIRKRVRAAEGVDPPAPDMTPPHVSKSAGRTPFADSSEIFIHDWEIEDFQGRLKARRAGSKAVSAAPTAGKAR
eukprot:CAMPEP_0181475740 /NCGR_PEP_ID=MMETSP1110-20121109/41342_1 /TAXON_ID=174948 /ORGANISM="Symbiodinium sp., Strain CCMP421" /LENGTH=112 /DNA_ID=CAMNT_0023600991 /DNA_START=49 /DNA_END=383 /DNA_ORIENTATION=-